MVDTSRTTYTVVGGGEWKRVPTTKKMTTRACVQSWDNSTRGLDASTTLDFVEGPRIMTNVLGQTTFVTLYQIGDGTYDLFDKVVVLDHGL